MHADLFIILKSVLKKRKITYADLALRLNLSEPTVKRIFAEKDCKLSRLVEICDALDLTLEDVIAQAERIESRPEYLEPHIEAELAAYPLAFHLFILLRDDMSLEAIKSHYNLEENMLFDLSRRLEKLGLIEIMPYGRIRLFHDQPIKYRRDGPLHRTLLELNMRFFRDVFMKTNTENSGFITKSRRISKSTARHIMKRLLEVDEELSHLSRQDQLMLSDDELQSYKISAAWAPISFSELLKLEEG